MFIGVKVNTTDYPAGYRPGMIERSVCDLF